MNENPYHSPATPLAVPALPRAGRPASLIVFGILNLVFGVLGVCGSAASSVMFFVDMPPNPGMPNPALDIFQSDGTYRLLIQAMLVLGVVFSLLLLAAGIGLLLSKAWGRTLSIAYGWYAIAAAVFGLVVNWIYLVQPMLANVNQAEGPAAAAAIGGAVGGLLGGCFSVIYPIILLVFMGRPALRNALSAGRTGPAEGAGSPR